jgi:hypothetical protein
LLLTRAAVCGSTEGKGKHMARFYIYEGRASEIHEVEALSADDAIHSLDLLWEALECDAIGGPDSLEIGKTLVVSTDKMFMSPVFVSMRCKVTIKRDVAMVSRLGAVEGLLLSLAQQLAADRYIGEEGESA